MSELETLGVVAPQHERHENDAYDTDPILALACAEWCRVNLEGRDATLGTVPLAALAAPKILDPMAGKGPYTAACRKVWPASWIAAIDLREEVRASLTEAGANYNVIRDIFTIPPETFAPVDLVLTNPSFEEADHLLRHLWPGLHSGASVVFLLNVGFIAGQDRWSNAGLYAIAPLQAFVPIVPRPSFIYDANGKPSNAKYEAALFVFTKGRSENYAIVPGPLRWTPAKKPRKPRTPRT